MPTTETFLARQARKLMRRPQPKARKACLETNRLEDRVVPTVSGFAFQDYNANGTFDTTSTIPNNGGTAVGAPAGGTIQTAIDSGMAALTVRVFNSAGALIDTQTTAANGSWTTAATAAGQQYRIEYSGLANGFNPGPHGANSGTSHAVRRRTGPIERQPRRGERRPGLLRRTIRLLVTPQFISYGGREQPATQASLISFGYRRRQRRARTSARSSSGDSNLPRRSTTSPMPASQVGATWGVAFNRQQADRSTLRPSPNGTAGWAPTAGTNPGGAGMLYTHECLPTQTAGTTPSVTTCRAPGSTCKACRPRPWPPTARTAWAIGHVNRGRLSPAWAANRGNWRQNQNQTLLRSRTAAKTGWNAVGKHQLRRPRRQRRRPRSFT